MKVLIAEDDRVSRRLLQGLLEKWGYQVVAAGDGAEAWSLCQENDFSLVISDWVMGELDGLELIRRIRVRQSTCYVYIILLTSLSQKNDVVRGMIAGADDFVSKPYDLEELRVRLLAGERVIRLEQTLIEQNRLIRETQAALIQSRNLASLGQLAAGMAHEINNPLGYVINNLAVLRRDSLAVMGVLDVYRQIHERLAEIEPAAAAEAARKAEAIDLLYVQKNLGALFDRSLAGLRRVGGIVENLRDFARLDEAEFKEVNLNDVMNTAIEVLRSEIDGKCLSLAKEFGPLPDLYCRAGKMSQVFFNILLNAIQASTCGGPISIKTDVDSVMGQIVIEFRDSGEGITPSNLLHIFEPFYTTRPVGQGKGLGLSVSYGIVRDHGGTIEVESHPDQDTICRVKLPLKFSPSLAPA